jgi:hypothetical protein
MLVEMGFVQDFKIVDSPYEQVVPQFTSGMGSLLQEGLRPALTEGERLRIKVAPAGWPAALARTVEVHPGPVRDIEDGVLVAFSWETGERSLFPRLDADFEVVRFGPQQTLISLRGRYEPPAGEFGRHADELLAHRIAESTLRAFLDGVCARLSARPLCAKGHGGGRSA